MDETLAKVAGSPKKRMPDAAIGSLLSAPTILCRDELSQPRALGGAQPKLTKVVDEVVRTVHAVQYEMKTAAAPENAMSERRDERVSSGLHSA